MKCIMCVKHLKYPFFHYPCAEGNNSTNIDDNASNPSLVVGVYDQCSSVCNETSENRH